MKWNVVDIGIKDESELNIDLPLKDSDTSFKL